MLSDRDIRWVLETKDLEITPSPLGNSGSQIQGACVDLRLDNVLKVPKDTIGDVTVELATFRPGRFIARNFTQVSITDNGYELLPKQFVLGQTVETIKLGNRLIGMIEGRSRFARLGIAVHVTAPKIDPGFHGPITLEIVNLGNFKCRFSAGMPVATLMLDWLSSPAQDVYNGELQGISPS